jgi:hypothetical protein
MMLEKIRSRSWREWLLFGRALVAMTTVVVTTRALPYKMWRRSAVARSHVRLRHEAVIVMSPQQVVRSIESASRFVFGGTNCLVQALTARMLMARYGLPSKLTVGVAKAPTGRLEGHAWLEHQGILLVGERGREGMVPMPNLEERL